MPSLNENIMSTLAAGPMSGAQLANRLGADTSTVNRQLKRLGSEVIRTGAGRSTLWYRPRPLPLLNGLQRLPIYRVDAMGRAEQIAYLHVVYPVNTYLVEYFRNGAEVERIPAAEWDYYESLPWWLTDMRPQGFLGRSFANQLRSAGLPVDSDPRLWSEDQVLAILASHPQDHVGNLLVGEQAYTRWLQAKPETLLSDSEAAERAEAIARGEHFDSSAQGEQPKLTARLGEGECIIKFSGRVESADVDSVALRWADLLRAEAVASSVLNLALPGIAAQGRSYTHNGRTFLASLRFDRTPEGGRQGVISLASLDAQFVGRANEPWPVIMATLFDQHVVTEEALVRCKIAWAFGQLTANTDMHLGNLSIINSGGRPYALAPIYDMLPMRFAPKAGGDLPAEAGDIRIHPMVTRVHWEVAYEPALQFWAEVLAHPEISDHFKVLAQKQLHIVKAFAGVIARMA